MKPKGYDESIPTTAKGAGANVKGTTLPKGGAPVKK